MTKEFTTKRMSNFQPYNARISLSVGLPEKNQREVKVNLFLTVFQC